MHNFVSRTTIQLLLSTMSPKGAVQFPCDICGQTFSRLCNYTFHLNNFLCSGGKKDVVVDKEVVIPRHYSKEQQEKIRRTKIMNTPIHHETEISGAKRRLREMLSMMTPEELPRSATSTNNMHLYNPPSLTQQKFQAVTLDKVHDSDDDECMKAPRILPKNIDVNLTPSLKAQIHLANILSSHNVNLSLFNDITSWVKLHSEDGRVDWEGSEWMKRDKLIHHMESILQTEGMRPQEKTVHLKSDNTSISVPVFDFTAMALSMLHDKSLMKEENIIPNYNLHTGTKVSPSENYDDITSGSVYQKAKLIYARGHDDMPIPIYVFIDETFTDLYGALKVAPVIFTFAFFKQECRNNVDFWRPLGFVPNLGYGKSKADKTSSQEKLQDFHDVLRTIFKSYIDVHHEGGIKTTITDFRGGHKNVTLKSWVHVVIGDTCGNNQLCGHYNTNGINLSRPYRDCKCDGDKMGVADPQCEYVSVNEIRQTEADPALCEKNGAMPSISKYKINNAFDHIPIADPDAGICLHSPPEGLHVFGNGIYASIFTVVHDVFGIKSSGKTQKEEIEVIHNKVVNDLLRQSERDLPRRSSRNGPLDGTKMGASERRGNLYALIITLLTVQGGNLLKKKLTTAIADREINHSKFIETILLCLAFEKWLHEERHKEEVLNAEVWVVRLKQLLLDHLDKFALSEESGNGWHTPKFHALSKFIFYISMFGCATNFFGGPCESALKKFIKNPGMNTQRRIASFCYQLALRNYEDYVFEFAYELIRHEFGDIVMYDTQETVRAAMLNFHDQAVPPYDNSDVVSAFAGEIVTEQDDAEEVDEEDTFEYQSELTHHFEGSFTLTIGRTQTVNRRTVREATVLWNHKIKNAIQHPISEVLLTVIKDKATNTTTPMHGEFQLTGHTMYKSGCDGKEIIYRASESFRGREWYDFAFIKYDEEMYPAKLLGFIQYTHGDLPVGMVRDETYAVVHCSDSSFDIDALSHQFVRGFELGVRDASFDIVPVSSIHGPMIAIPNYGHDKATRYITALPYRDWGNYFKNKMEIIDEAESGERNNGSHWMKHM